MGTKVTLDFTIPLDKSDPYASIGEFYLPIYEKIYNWIIENCTSRVIQTDNDGGWGEILELEFDDPKEATLFKLTWGVERLCDDN